MGTTAENLRELLPAAEPKPPPSLMPELPAPPGVAVKAQAPGELMTLSSTAPATTSVVQPQETTAGQLKELLSSGSPYLQQARAGATRYAAARGLQNSSIAAQAGEQAAIREALPIASQDAGTFERRELTRLGVENQRELMREQGTISSRLQSEAHTQQQQLQQSEQQQQQWLAQFDASTRERLQGLDAEVRQGMQGLELEAQERIAGTNVAAASRNDAARMATSMELAYSAFLESIMANPDIPADARQTYMNHAIAIRDSNLALVEQLFDIDLEWGLV